MRERQRILSIITLALFFSVLVWSNYSAVLPLVIEEWGLSGLEAGIIFGAFQIGYLLVVVPAGWLADRYSPRYVIAIGAAGAGLTSFAFAASADGFLTGVVLRFLSGLFMAGVYVPGMRFVSDWYPAEARGRAMGIYVGIYEFGSGLSFVFATVAAEAVDWRLAIGVTSVGAVVVAPVVLGFTRDHPEHTRSREFGFDTSLFRNREFLCAVSIYSWHNWELFGVRNWLVAFLVATPAFAATDSTVLAGLTVGAMIIVGGIGNITGGWLSDRLSRTKTVGIGLTASAILSAFFGFLGTLPIILLVGITLIYGFVLSMDSAPLSTLVTEVAANENIGTALSIQSLVGFSTTGASPVVFGLALDRAGYTTAFPTLAAGALLGLLSVGILVWIRAN